MRKSCCFDPEISLYAFKTVLTAERSEEIKVNSLNIWILTFSWKTIKIAGDFGVDDANCAIDAIFETCWIIVVNSSGLNESVIKEKHCVKIWSIGVKRFLSQIIPSAIAVTVAKTVS